MFGFGSRKKMNFEEHVRTVLGLRGSFSRSSMQTDIRKLSELLEKTNGRKEFVNLIYSRQFDYLRENLKERQDLKEDNLEEIIKKMIKERNL